jgi:UDP-N-acetylglucosamine 1-carboxyvinyltransferase
MAKIVIQGPAKLSGRVKLQGAKNSAMKHVFIPLISNGQFTLNNIPDIGSINKHLDLISLLGLKVDRLAKNQIFIDSSNIIPLKIIPKEFLYYTSGANHIIPILVSKFGECEVETDISRKDYGGDQIGSRVFKDIIDTLKLCGIVTLEKHSSLLFKLQSQKPFEFNVPVGSFTATILAIFSALFKSGTSKIYNYTKVHEFEDIIDFLTSAGAKISKYPEFLEITGPTKLKGIKYTNMNDPHDFVTWLFAGLSTNSQINIQGIQFEKMKLQTLDNTLKGMNINANLHNNILDLLPQLSKIRPANIIAGQYPLFTTEWQVLISPLLTQVKGESRVVESFYSNRMQHWSELSKLGAKFSFYKVMKYKEIDGHPRAVKLNGTQSLHGSKVNALDVRTGAALIIAGLIADGVTEISQIENIDRGYENLVDRLRSLGAKIKIEN